MVGWRLGDDFRIDVSDSLEWYWRRDADGATIKGSDWAPPLGSCDIVKRRKIGKREALRGRGCVYGWA